MSKIVTRFGTFVSIIFLLSIVDTFVSGHLESKTTYRALPGTTQFVTGKLEQPIDSITGLTYTSETSAIRLVFVESQGRIWRGKLEVDPGATSGEYAFCVFPKRTLPNKGTPVYRVLVFTDKNQYRASYKSVSRKYLGIAPWWISVCTLPLVLVSLSLSYYLSGKQETRLARKGIVPIAKMVRRNKQWEITFGLGRNHGIGPGDHLLLLDDHLERVGEVIATRVGAEESQASADLSEEIGPNFFIAKK